MADENTEDTSAPDRSAATSAHTADAQPTGQYPTLPLTPVQQTPAQRPAQRAPVQQAAVASQAPSGTSSTRSRWLGWTIAGAVVAILIVSAGTAWGVSAAVTGNANASAAAPAAQHSIATAKPGARGGRTVAAAKRHVVHAAIDSIGADTWKVTTAQGRTATVVITAKTVFGTASHPATRSSFAAGSKVIMVVTATHGKNARLVAHRITRPHSVAEPSATSQPSI
ncbi:MAG: hypothetical protein EPN48_11935 [Microbacteriaceae bacterium]|nr:MAG: hypothetical protein EPN48_11935 [Microbacteriaceae bacterium]